MKNRKIVLLIVLIIIIIASIVTYFLLSNNTELFKNKKDPDQVYECKFIITDNFELNTFKENHTYDIVVNNDVIKKVNVYKDYYFNDKESFDRIYSMYNSDKANGYIITGFDFDSKILSITKEERTKLSYQAYLKANNINEQYCKLKETSKKVSQEHKTNKTDSMYVCKYNNLITYITVDSKNVITSVKNGTVHQMKTLEEYNEIKAKLKDTEHIQYIYNENNLTITLLEKMIITNDMNYDDYVKGSLSGYKCELSNE